MPVLNTDIAESFDEIADLLEIRGANPFRIRAYRNAARVVAGWPVSLAENLKTDQELPKIPGIGQDLSEKIREMIENREILSLLDLRKETPPGLRALLRVPGLGPKRVKLLQVKLHVSSMGDLERVLRTGKLRELRGFGPKTETRILTELDRTRSTQERTKLVLAEGVVGPLLEYFEKIQGVNRAIAAGSFRRRLETVGDIDILVSCGKQAGRAVREAFLAYEDRRETLASGETRSTIVLRSGIQVDLRVVPPESYGSALHYFTGSKAHNIAIRALGLKRGLKINEYGVFRGSRRLGGKSEEEVFKAVGLPFIEPELRENNGEIEAARRGRLPRLITLEQIRGDLHAHSVATDGRASIAAMAEAAKKRGYDYLAITDHSRHLTVARGLDTMRLRKQLREIDALNAQSKNFRILKAIEVDILENGRLDLPDGVLGDLDLCVCSIHFKFELSRRRQTERIIRAMDNPHFHVLAHPSGRLIEDRPPMDIDYERIMKAARERGCFLEINAQPERMDLNPALCKLAKEIGVKLVISSDAHGESDLGLMNFGISQARRGWIEAEDVVNTRSWSEARKLLRSTPS